MIDFYKRLTKEQKEKIEKNKQDLIRRTIDIIDVYDEHGNKFTKTVILDINYSVISFGGFCEYYLNDLIKNIFSHLCKNGNINKFVIDAMGRNHLGYEVSIPINETIELLSKAIKLRNKLTKEDKLNGISI